MTFSQIAVAGLFFIIIFLSGFWLSHSGKPYNSIFLNIHKLIALAALVYLVITIHRLTQGTKLSTVELAACAVTGLLFLVTIISGGLASIDQPLPAAFPVLHRILPYLVLLSTGLTLYLVARLR